MERSWHLPLGYLTNNFLEPFFEFSELQRGQEEARSREEERITASIPLDFLLVIFLWIELLPHAGWKDMFIAFVPPAINDFGVRWVIIGAFEIIVLRWLFGSLELF